MPIRFSTRIRIVMTVLFDPKGVSPQAFGVKGHAELVSDRQRRQRSGSRTWATPAMSTAAIARNHPTALGAMMIIANTPDSHLVLAVGRGLAGRRLRHGATVAARSTCRPCMVFDADAGQVALHGALAGSA